MNDGNPMLSLINTIAETKKFAFFVIELCNRFTTNKKKRNNSLTHLVKLLMRNAEKIVSY